ncbi:MAG: helix-turn-helix transcriptional regulator, partial [bacterium]
MTERIQQLISDKKLSPTQFSDEIGIQRSSLSHVLSGRNKPSLDFMLKIKTRFPEVNLDWLLLGEGNMYQQEDGEQESKESLSRADKITEERDLSVETKQKAEETWEGAGARRMSGIEKLDNPTDHVPSEKGIQQLLIIYKDGTFT